MKKLLVVALVLLYATGAALAADDVFSTKGEYRVEFYSKENYSDYDDSTTADELQYIDQRFRVAWNWNPAEGVYAHLRTDLAEDTWGDGPGINYRPDAGHPTIMVDRAYIDVQKSFITFKAGLLSAGFGNSIAIDDQQPSIVLKANFAPIEISALYIKYDEGGSLADNVDANEDTDLYGIGMQYASDLFSGGAFYALRKDETGTDDDKYVFGAYGSASMGMVKFAGEVDFFGGDVEGGNDYVGTNVWLNGEAALSEAFKVGLDLFYAPGTTDSTETQISFVTDDGSFVPLDYGAFKWVHFNGLDPFQIDTNAGSVSGQLYASFAAAEGLTFFANVAYLQPEEDTVTNLDSYTLASVSAQYGLAPNTTFHVKYEYIAPEYDDNTTDDPAQGIMGMIKVKF